MKEFSADTIRGDIFDENKYTVEEMFQLDEETRNHWMYRLIIDDAQIEKDGQWKNGEVIVSTLHNCIYYRFLSYQDERIDDIGGEEYITFDEKRYIKLDFANEKFGVKANIYECSITVDGLKFLCSIRSDFNICVMGMKIADYYKMKGMKLYEKHVINAPKYVTNQERINHYSLEIDEDMFSVKNFSFVIYDDFGDVVGYRHAIGGYVCIRDIADSFGDFSISDVSLYGDKVYACLQPKFNNSNSRQDSAYKYNTYLGDTLNANFYLDSNVELLGNPNTKTIYYCFRSHGQRCVEVKFESERDYYCLGEWLVKFIKAYNPSFSVPVRTSLSVIAEQKGKLEDNNEHEPTFSIVNKKINVSDGLPESAFETSINQLDELIGLDIIKQDVRELVNLAKMQRLRKEKGMIPLPISLHLVFTGNPGTGKTTVARILANLYKEIGLLTKGQLVEVDRSGLVAGYVGQTAIKTKEKIEEAIGGILFVDEAYSLVKDGNDYGQEAIDTILKVMEDNRDDLIVIVAGYPELMTKFVNSNPGLRSRFNKYINFPDYNAKELECIFYSMCSKYGYSVEDSSKIRIAEYMSDMEKQKDKNFANARDVRNLFEKIIANQVSRVMGNQAINEDDMMLIKLEDLL